MELPRRPVSPLGPAPAKAATASPARRTTARQSRHRSPIRSAAPSSRKHQSHRITPAMTKASASRNTENLRGVEAVVSVDRISNSEGAEGSDISTVALRLVGSGADDTPPSAPRNSKLCQLWVLAGSKCDLTGRAAFDAKGRSRRGLHLLTCACGWREARSIG